METLRDFTVRCPYCGERQSLEVDLTESMPQEYISDCTVCCRPIQVTVTSGGRGEPVLRVRTEDDTA